jgi:radical SAM superfamily enzyme YgiQ (UPF0313 family)
MRVLLVNPEFPESYWSGRNALPFARRKSLLPPLGLITVAALLPGSWTLKLVDLEVDPLHDEDLVWADVVMVTGMLVQKGSMQEILRRCRDLEVETVVGGPYATSSPEELDLADHLVLGEGEEIIPVLAADLEAGRAERIYKEEGKPDVTTSPVPRYDLLRRNVYHQMSLQYSRGCPFLCEFCDIIVMYGRRPRTKMPAQVVAELEAIHATGFAGDIFFVDDNFIGNKKEVRTMLPHLAEWRRRSRAPFEFYTEASMNLADDLDLVDQMTDAGFTSVFIGIETPSPEALAETRKIQNLKRDLAEQVHSLLERGMDVWAGAMVGMLGALPNTPLFARLKKEGRLRPDFKGDQFGLTNVITKIPAEQMVAGYRRVLENLYSPDEFFRRCRENLARWKPVPGSVRRPQLRDVRNALRAIRGQGLSGPYRRAYWRFLRWVVRHQPQKLARALAQAAAGHHYITYTRKVVVPSLKEQARSLPDPLPVAPIAPAVVFSSEA